MIIYCVKFRDIYMCELGVICLLKPCLLLRSLGARATSVWEYHGSVFIRLGPVLVHIGPVLKMDGYYLLPRMDNIYYL